MGNRKSRNAKKAEEAKHVYKFAASVALTCDRCPAIFSGQVGYDTQSQSEMAHRQASRIAASNLAGHLVDVHHDELTNEAKATLSGGSEIQFNPAMMDSLTGQPQEYAAFEIPGMHSWQDLPVIGATEPWPTDPRSTHETGFAGDPVPPVKTMREFGEERWRRESQPKPARTLAEAFPVNTSMQDVMLSQLERCWAIMLHRCKRYDEAWLNRGANGNVLEILKLSDRIKAQLWDRRYGQGDVVMDDDLDDVRDLVNYALVCLTQAELGQWNKRG